MIPHARVSDDDYFTKDTEFIVSVFSVTAWTRVIEATLVGLEEIDGRSGGTLDG